MLDAYLKFDDEAAALAALAMAGLTGKPDGTWAVDQVGTVYSDPVLEEDGEILEAPVALPGYHINVRMVSGALPEPLAPFRVFPGTPARMFA